jgi:hypothetical protein
MFGWAGKLFDRIAEAMVRRGQAAVEAADRTMGEKRASVRAVRDALSEAMTCAEVDRDRGIVKERQAAITAANQANAVVHEIDDEDARRLVVEWKRLFDAIPKGWKGGELVSAYGDARLPPGYPEPAWTELRAAADLALDRLGAVLRELLERRR